MTLDALAGPRARAAGAGGAAGADARGGPRVPGARRRGDPARPASSPRWTRTRSPSPGRPGRTSSGWPRCCWRSGSGLGGWELLAVLRAALVAASIGLLVATAIARGASPADRGDPLAARPSRWRRPRWRCGRSCSGSRSSPLLLLLVARRDAESAPPLACARARDGLGERPRRASSSGRSLLGYAWLDDLVRGRPARRSFVVLVVGHGRHARQPVRDRRLGVRRGDRRQPGDLRPGQRVAADDAVHRARAAVLPVRSAAAALALASAAGRRCDGRTGCWLAAMFADRGLGGPRSRVVAVRGGLRARVACRTPCREGARPARVPRAIPHAAHDPARSRGRGGDARASVVRGRPAVVAARGPADRPRRACSYAPSGRSPRRCRAPAPAGARVLVPQTWASWFEWAVPDALYFIDSRFELFPADVWADRAAIAAGGPAADEVLAAGRWRLLVLPAGRAAPSGRLDRGLRATPTERSCARIPVTAARRWYLESRPPRWLPSGPSEVPR